MDLLDKIFDLNESTRISVRGIKSHPWFKKPMRAHLQEAIERMEAEQAANERRCAAGDFTSSNRDSAIRDLIVTASSPEFRQQCANVVGSPVRPNSKLEILSRIQLRTVLDAYPKFDKSSVHVMLKHYVQKK